MIDIEKAMDSKAFDKAISKFFSDVIDIPNDQKDTDIGDEKKEKAILDFFEAAAPFFVRNPPKAT